MGGTSIRHTRVNGRDACVCVRVRFSSSSSFVFFLFFLFLVFFLFFLFLVFFLFFVFPALKSRPVLAELSLSFFLSSCSRQSCRGLGNFWSS